MPEGSKHRFYNTSIPTYNVGTRKVEAREAADRLPEDLVPAKAEESAHEYTIDEEELTVWWTGALAQQWNEAPRRSAELGHSPEHEYPVYALFENLAGGATIDEFVEWFPGVEKKQVRAVLELEARALRKALAH